MPKIDKVATIHELVSRLAELAGSTTEVLEEVKSQLSKSRSKKPVAVELKGKQQRTFIDLCDEMGQADEQLARFPQDAAEVPACKNLILQCKAKLTDIRLRTNIRLNEAVQDDFTVDLTHEQLQQLIAAYKQDTLLDGTWGGEMEAEHGATVLGFRCKVFVRSNGTFQHVYTVGQGAAVSTFHLLHSGKHYEVIKYDAQHGDAYSPVRVQAIAPDGDCLYNSLRNIAGRLLRPQMTRAVLRNGVAQRLTDAEVGIAIYSIILGDRDGLGPNVSGLLPEIAPAVMGFDDVDSEHYAQLAKKAKSLKSCSRWSQLSSVKGDCIAVAGCLDTLLEDPRLVATIKKQWYGGVAGSGGTAFSMVAVNKRPEAKVKGKEVKGAPSKPVSKPPEAGAYPCVATYIGESVYEVKGRSSNADDHAEAKWFEENNETVADAASEPDCLFLEAHDTKAPCPEICTPRLYLIAREVQKPLMVYTYGDWGHWQNNKARLVKLFPKELGKKEWFPILLFIEQGVFLVGIWDGKLAPFFFPAQ